MSAKHKNGCRSKALARHLLRAKNSRDWKQVVESVALDLFSISTPVDGAGFDLYVLDGYYVQ